MNIDDEISNRIRAIVREELASLNGQVKRFTPDELAERWHTDPATIRYLVYAGKLKAIRISERRMVFSIEEILRFEDAGGIDQSQVAA